MEPVLSLNPNLITLARESRGLSQKEMAASLGMSTGKVCRVEQGDQVFTDEVLTKLSKLLGYPKEFFVQDVEAFLPTSINFRKRLKVPQRAIAPITAQMNLYRINVEQLTSKVKVKRPDIPELTKAQLSDPVLAAKAVRTSWGMHKGAISNLIGIMERKGILVISFDFGTERVDSRTIVTKDGYPILFYNKTMLGDRLRFSLCYELGHLILHSRNMLDINRDIDHEANVFAAEFLMPASEIKKDLREEITLPVLGQLKQKWGASMQAILYRASDLDLITYNQKRYLLGQFNAMGIRRREPQEFDIAIEKPKYLRDLITRYRNNTQLSVKEMAAVFHLTPEDFLSRYAD